MLAKFSLAAPPAVGGLLMRWTVIGLGNHTHPLTRHSIGQYALLNLHAYVSACSAEPASFGSKRPADLALSPKRDYKSATLKLSNAPHEVDFVLPRYAMNENGRVLRGLPNAQSHSIIALHDDLELAQLKIKSRFGGSHKGHNGLRSIEAALGTPKYWRIRIGIGRPDTRDRMSVVEHVMGPLHRREIEELSFDHDPREAGQSLKEIWQLIEQIMSESPPR